jgi:hypothetical protein
MTSGSASDGSTTPGMRAASAGHQREEVAGAAAELDAQLVDRTDGGVGTQRLGERLPGGREAVVAAAVEHNPVPRVDLAGELGRQARLADARLTAQEDTAAAPGGGVVPGRPQRGELRLAPRVPGPPVADERGGERDDDPAPRGPWNRPGPHRQHEVARRELARVHELGFGSRPGQQPHDIGDEDACRWRGGTQPLRLDHRRAGVVLARPGEVTSGDSDAQVEPDRAAAGLPVDRPLQLHRAGHGGAGRREGRHHAVAERLLGAGAVRGEDVAQAAVVLAADEVRVTVAEPRAHLRRARQLREQDRRRHAADLDLGRRLSACPMEQGRVVGEDRPLQPLELEAGAQAELGVERPDGLTVGVQRLALASGAIEGEHELAAQALAQPVRRHELLQLADELGAAAHGQLRLDAILHRGGAEVLEARDLRRRQRLEGHVGERGPAPFVERCAQARRRALGAPGGQRPPPVLAQPLEPPEVELVRLDPQAVAGGAADQPRGLAAERAPQARDDDLHRLDRTVGWPLTPSSSITRSRATGSPACSSSSASSARCRAPATTSGRPSARTSSGPRIRKSTSQASRRAAGTATTVGAPQTW